MTRLILKDLLAQKKLMLLWGLYSLCFYAPALFIEDWSPSLPLILVAIPVLVGVMFVIGGAKLEGSNAELLVASFPVSRRMMADAKFVGMLLAAAYGFATSLAFGLAFRATGARISIGAFDWLVLPRIAAGLGLLSWLVPLYLKQGADFIRKFTVIGLAVAVALQLLVMLLFREDSGAVASALRAFLAWYRSFDPAARSLTLAAAGIAVGAISWLASRRVMSRKEF